MSKEFKSYRRDCFTAIRQLLCCKPEEVVNHYIELAKATKNDRQLSQVMADVRKII